MYNVQRTMYILLCTMYNVRCTMYDVRCAVQYMVLIMYGVLSVLHCTRRTMLYVFVYDGQLTFYDVRSTVYDVLCNM